MTGWRFELKGDVLDLQYFCRLFQVGRVEVRQDADRFWMSSTAISADMIPADAHAAAEGLLRTMNGIAALRIGGMGPITLGSAERVQESGRREIVVFPKPVGVRLRLGWAIVHINGEPPPPKEDSILVAAASDAEVEQVLRMYASRGLDWRDLYFILDLVEADITRGKRRKTVTSKGWMTGSQRKRFMQTANSRQAIGDLARHGRVTSAPKDPLELAQARRLIASVVLSWINEKGLRPAESPE